MFKSKSDILLTIGIISLFVIPPMMKAKDYDTEAERLRLEAERLKKKD